MPYLEAVILETLRLSSVLPMGVWHSTLEDVEFHGFQIPKDTMIIPLQYAVHYDPIIWKDPMEFNPQRFMEKSKSGESRCLKNESLIPFSVGKRVCIGESLAKDELFLMISSILQNFCIKTDPNDEKPSIIPIPGPISSPQPHKVIFNLR